jgi:hypothetical protein
MQKQIQIGTEPRGAKNIFAYFPCSPLRFVCKIPDRKLHYLVLGLQIGSYPDTNQQYNMLVELYSHNPGSSFSHTAIRDLDVFLSPIKQML